MRKIKAQLLSSITMKEYLMMIEDRIKKDNTVTELKWVEDFIRQVEKAGLEEFDSKKDKFIQEKLKEFGA